mgnify:CR=1 FL=1
MAEQIRLSEHLTWQDASKIIQDLIKALNGKKPNMPELVAYAYERGREDEKAEKS